MLFSTKSKRFFWIITVITYAFRIIGLAPFTVQSNARARNSRQIFFVTFLFSKTGQVYNLLLLVLLSTMTVLALPFMYFLNYVNKSPLTQANDILHGISCSITITVVIMNWVFKQKNAVRLSNRLLEIDRLLHGTENRLISKRVLMYFVVHAVFNISLWITLIATDKEPILNYLIAWFWINVPSFIIYWFIIEYSIVVKLLINKFQTVNKNLSRLKEFPNYLSGQPSFSDRRLTVSSFSTHGRLVSLRTLHRIRTMLFELSQDMAEFFSLPILFCIGASFFSLVYNCYYLTSPFLIKNGVLSNIVLSNTVGWILISIYPLSNLCFSVTKAVQEAKTTGWIVHKLLATTTNQQIKAELNQWSLQLLHEHLSFTAYGFFVLDSTLLYSVLGATATYLIILIQFLHVN